MLATRKLVLAASGAVALCLAGAVAAPALARTDPSLPPVCTVGSPVTEPCVVSLQDGAHVRLRVPDVLCINVDALSSRTTADARVHLPCPVHRYPVFKDCAQANAAGASNIPSTSSLYRKDLDTDGDGIACETVPPVDQAGSGAEAPPPVTVVTHLPVTH